MKKGSVKKVKMMPVSDVKFLLVDILEFVDGTDSAISDYIKEIIREL